MNSFLGYRAADVQHNKAHMLLSLAVTTHIPTPPVTSSMPKMSEQIPIHIFPLQLVKAVKESTALII